MENSRLRLYPSTAGIPYALHVTVFFAIQAIIGRLFGLPVLDLHHIVIVFAGLLLASAIVAALTMSSKSSRVTLDGSWWQTVLFSGVSTLVFKLVVSSWAVSLGMSLLLGLVARFVHQTNTDSRV